MKDHSRRFRNIHFHPAVKIEEVIDYTSSADVGIALTDASCLNHIYSLPNKVFEYIVGGIPIIVSDFLEMGKLIDNYHCGWKIRVEERLVKKLLEGISKDQISEKKINTLKVRYQFDWSIESKRLLKVYQAMVT